MDVDVLFFSAHPDDAEYGMGGTYIKIARRYKTAHVILTKGDAGTYGTPEEREKESIQAAKFVGTNLEFLDYLDNHIEDNLQTVMKIAAVIRKYKPKIIFAPYHTDMDAHYNGMAHPDHTALGRIVLKATRYAKFKNSKVEGEAHMVSRIIYYMVPLNMKPTMIIDIKDVFDDLKKLWLIHKSQESTMNGKIIDILTAQRKYVAGFNKLEYAETFIVDDPLHIDVENILGL